MAWWHRSWMPPPRMLEKLRCESYCYYCFILLLLFLFPLLSLLPYRSNKKPARPANAGLVKGGWGGKGENEEGKGGDINAGGIGKRIKLPLRANQ